MGMEEKDVDFSKKSNQKAGGNDFSAAVRHIFYAGVLPNQSAGSRVDYRMQISRALSVLYILRAPELFV